MEQATVRRVISRAVAWLAATAVVAAMLLPAPAVASDKPFAASSLPSEVPLEGVLKVVPIEPEADSDDHHVPRADIVTLVTAQGTSVELTGDEVATAVSGDRFAGTVAVGKSLRDAVSRRLGAEAQPKDDEELGELVAEVSATAGIRLTVTAATLTPLVEPVVAAKAHTVDVMYIGETGKPTPSIAAIDAAVDRLKEFWVSQSNGQISGITRPLAVKYAVKTKAQLCDAYALWDFASGPSGFNRPTLFPGEPSAYYWAASNSVHLLVIVPGDVCGTGNGLGTIGTMHSGGTTWSSVDVAKPANWDGVVFHEVGHNLGLGHSNVTVCSAAPVVDGPSPTCQQDEYRDFFDVMGGGYTWGAHSNSHDIAALNVTQKVRLDALPRGSALREVRVAGGKDQEFALAPASATTGTRGLEILDPLNNDLLYVEYRSGTGRDAPSFYSQVSADPTKDQTTYAPGVRVLKIGCTPASACDGSSTTKASTVLRRWVSSTATALSFRAGDDFISRSSSGGLPGVRIGVVSTSAEGATVHVSFDYQLPTFTKPTVTATGTPSYYRTLTATANPAWSPVPTTLAHQWLRNAEPIPGATAAAYRVQAADLGQKLSVRVTAKKTGVATASVTSAQVTVATTWSPVKVSGAIGLPSGVPPSAWQDMRVRAFAVDQMPSGAQTNVETTVNPATGAYTLTGLTPGRWRLQAQPAAREAGTAPADVAAQWYGGTPDAESAAVITVDEDKAGVSFTLPRSLRISGTVSLPPGSDPSWRGSIIVEANPAPYQTEGLQPRRSSARVAASTGQYEIAGLDPGAYSLRFVVDDEMPSVPLAATYYPGVVAYQDRTDLTLDQANRTGVNVTMLRQRTISGKVTLPAGKPSSWYAYLSVEVRGTHGGVSDAAVAANGTYSVGRLNPDRYTVCIRIDDWADITDLVTTCVDGTHNPIRSTPVDVRAGDLSNVTIIAKSGRTISGTVRPPAGTPAAHLAGTMVRAVPLTPWGEPDWSDTTPSAYVDPVTGAYTLRRVIPGRVLVRFDPPYSWYDPNTGEFGETGLVPLWYGGTLAAAAGTAVDVTTTSASAVDITLAKATAGIRGTLAVPAISGAIPYAWLRVLDQTGTEEVGWIDLEGSSFAATLLVPGSYRLLLTVHYDFTNGKPTEVRTQYLRAPGGSKTFVVPAAGLSGQALTAAAAGARVFGSLTAAGFDDSDRVDLAHAYLYERDGTGWVRYPAPLADIRENGSERFTSPYLAAGTYTIGYQADGAVERYAAAGIVQEWWKDRASLSSADEIALSGSQQLSGFHGAVHVVGVEPPEVVDPPIAAATPVVTGTPQVGATLTAKPGTWSPVPTFSYQWSVAGTLVAGATGATFVPREADIGKTVTVQVTGSEPGYTTTTKVSNPTQPVVAKPVPLVAATPTISGTPRIGVKLTAKPGAWTSGTSFSYQWLVSGKAVSGATKSTFTSRSADKGKTVTVRVTGSKAGYISATKTSKATAKVLARLKLSSATPKISGTAKVGAKLTAKPGTWTSGTTFTYQWLVSGKAVSGATTSKFVPRSADKGKTVTVRVTGRKAGYTTVTKTSKATGAVTK